MIDRKVGDAGAARWTKRMAGALGVIVIVVVWGGVQLRAGEALAAATEDAATAVRPALAVTVAPPQHQRLPVHLSANGELAAWQEAVIGSDVGDLRLQEVRVEVGDRVKAGQVLAVFEDAIPKAEVAQARASVAEAQAAVAEAAANAQRARELKGSGALSTQLATQYLTGEQTARARLEAARATLALRELRLRQTRIVAPDDGVISARTAAVGSVTGMGGELFRLIRQGRLEWRAEVSASEIGRLREGLAVVVRTAAGGETHGTVRKIAPTVDSHTRTAMVYVDLPPDALAQGGNRILPGMFARGEFQLAEEDVLTVPQQAVVVRDGLASVFVVGEDSRVRQQRVTMGERHADRVAIVEGLDAAAQVVQRGGVFLNDGDLVRVVAAAPDQQ